MGPFDLMDLVGLDVNLAAARGIFAACLAAGDPAAERFRPSPIQERLVAAGRLGRKTDGGFYAYDEAGRSTGPAPEFDRADDPGRRLTDAEIVRRITLAIVNEAYRASGTASPGRRHRSRHATRGGAPERAIRARRRPRRPGGGPRGAGSPFGQAVPARASARRVRAGPVATIQPMTRDPNRPLREAWIVEAVRTPIGRYGGALASVRPDDLAAAVLRAVVDRAGVDPASSRTSSSAAPTRPARTTATSPGWRSCSPASRSRSVG